MSFLQEYHDRTVIPCRHCSTRPGLCSQLTFEKLLPFVGSDFRGVLLLGHSPKVRTRSIIDTTLDLNMPRQIQRYIINKVLAPLGIELEWCAAINLVRCLTHSMPEETEADGMPLMDAAFLRCREHLIQEIVAIQPRLLISLSETTSNALQNAFQPWVAKRPMKEIVATWRSLHVGGLILPWIPVVHIPKGRTQAFYFPLQTERLAALLAKVHELPPWSPKTPSILEITSPEGDPPRRTEVFG